MNKRGAWPLRWRKWKKWWLQYAPTYAYVRKIAWTCVFVAVLATLLAAEMLPDPLDLRVGEPSPRDLKAPKEFVDRPTTERLRQQAAERVSDVYTLDAEVTESVLSGIAGAFQEIRQIQALTAVEMNERVALVRDRVGLELPDDVAVAVLEADPRTLQLMEGGARSIAEDLMGAGIKPEHLESTRMRVPELVRALELSRPHERFTSLLLQDRLRANLFFDEEATLAARQQARNAVEPVLIRKDQIIVREGEPVDEDDLVRLQDAGLLRQEESLTAIVGSVLLAGLLVALLALYLHLYNPDVYDDASRVVLVGITALGTVLVAWVMLPLSGYAVPVAAGTMLVAILIDARLAAFLSGLLAGIVAIFADGDLQLLFVVLAGSLVGVFAVTRIGQRADLMRAGFYVAIANAAVILAWNLLPGGLALADIALWRNVFWGTVGGLLSSVLMIGSLPFLESLFGLVTSVRLLELANPNQPLLRRLLLEAPGTYHHSIMVANLCEAAAERVGADSLLARVGAYYHDIGKMKRPYFFIENQFGNANPHEKLAPNLSALIITSHVKDGVELAREYKLPREIIRFIQEHHGTMTVEYFYHKAVNEQDEKSVLEENFRYPGPKPRSKETAICLLADGCEAAVRAMTKPTPSRIEATVRRIIRDR
ncbi:MAG TPA: HDIG domain-containing metalloprotein, partial [Bacillota bacterium]